MVSTTEGAVVKLYLETLDVLIRLKEKSSHNASLFKKIEELQSKIVDDISTNLHL